MLAFMPVRLASDGLAFLFLSTLPSFGSTQIKMRYTETVWQLMNNIQLLQDESGRLCSITEEVFLLLKDTISSVPNISPFASN